MNTFDLTSVTFEEFVTFLFDHEVDDSPRQHWIELPPDAEITVEISFGTLSELGDPTMRPEPDPWYFSLDDVQFDPGRLVGHYTRLFEAPEFLLERFTPAQLDQGFWAIHGGALDCSVQDLMWDPAVAFDERARCVRAMAGFFDRLAALDARNPAPSPWWKSLHMWWDSLAYDWHCGNRARVRGGEDLLMQDVIFQTLRTILDLDDNECRAAALHGLGHLHHPETNVLVRDWLERVGEGIDDELRSYALSAAAFEVL